MRAEERAVVIVEALMGKEEYEVDDERSMELDKFTYGEWTKEWSADTIRDYMPYFNTHRRPCEYNPTIKWNAREEQRHRLCVAYASDYYRPEDRRYNLPSLPCSVGSPPVMNERIGDLMRAVEGSEQMIRLRADNVRSEPTRWAQYADRLEAYVEWKPDGMSKEELELERLRLNAAVFFLRTKNGCDYARQVFDDGRKLAMREYVLMLMARTKEDEDERDRVGWEGYQQAEVPEDMRWYDRRLTMAQHEQRLREDEDDRRRIFGQQEHFGAASYSQRDRQHGVRRPPALVQDIPLITSLCNSTVAPARADSLAARPATLESSTATNPSYHSTTTGPTHQSMNSSKPTTAPAAKSQANPTSIARKPTDSTPSMSNPIPEGSTIDLLERSPTAEQEEEGPTWNGRKIIEGVDYEIASTRLTGAPPRHRLPENPFTGPIPRHRPTNNTFTASTSNSIRWSRRVNNAVLDSHNCCSGCGTLRGHRYVNSCTFARRYEFNSDISRRWVDTKLGVEYMQKFHVNHIVTRKHLKPDSQNKALADQLGNEEEEEEEDDED
jgi:hypothetical protein